MNYLEYEVYIQRFGINEEVKINASFTGIKELLIKQVSQNQQDSSTKPENENKQNNQDKDKKDKKDTIIRFVLEENVTDINEAKAYCEIALNEMMNVFSWHTGGQVGLPKQGKSNFNGVTSVHADICGSCKVLTKEEKLNQIKADIEHPKGDNDYIRLYRFAFLNEDNVSKFLILYSILYLIKEKQEYVDKYIKTKEPNVEEKPSTKKPKKPGDAEVKETIYTYLRNQIGHIQSNSDGKYVRTKIQSVLDKFTEIVKAAIDEKIQRP